MQRMRSDDGAVAVLVAILAVVLFGFGALVIDVGALYAERRQLQNGADAAAFAVAEACAAGDCGPYQANAELFADGNASDGFSRVAPGEVCGSTDAGLPACANPPADLVGSGYVRVRTRTQEPDGTNLVPPFLATVLDPGYQGTEVSATATVVWGAPGGIDAELAVTFSQCEYEKLTKDADGNTIYATEPYDPALERTIYFHDSTDAGTCGAGPSGADLPGGFGWLDADDDCSAVIENGWTSADTGASASKDCKAALNALLGQTVLIPVFDYLNEESGTNGGYHIWTYVGFVLTGYRFPGASYPDGANAPCSSSQTCIRGYFVEVVAPAMGPVTDGPDQGVRVVQLIS
jgi:hypothetical protein